MPHRLLPSHPSRTQSVKRRHTAGCADRHGTRLLKAVDSATDLLVALAHANIQNNRRREINSCVRLKAHIPKETRLLINWSLCYSMDILPLILLYACKVSTLCFHPINCVTNKIQRLDNIVFFYSKKQNSFYTSCLLSIYNHVLCQHV